MHSSEWSVHRSRVRPWVLPSSLILNVTIGSGVSNGLPNPHFLSSRSRWTVLPLAPLLGLLAFWLPRGVLNVVSTLPSHPETAGQKLVLILHRAMPFQCLVRRTVLVGCEQCVNPTTFNLLKLDVLPSPHLQGMNPEL